MIHLDTSVLIRAMDPSAPESRRIATWHRFGETLVLSAVAWSEFLCGPLSAEDPARVERLVHRWRDYRVGDAVMAARLFNESGRRRGSMADCMIAAAALADGAALATANAADFERFEALGLRLAGNDG